MSDAGTEVSQVEEPPETPSGGGAAPTAKAATHGGWRVGLSIFLAILVGVLAPLTVLGAWVKAQVKSTDAWVSTVGPLADNPQVQQYVATELTDALFEVVPVEQFLSENLPGPLAAAAPTLTSALQGFVLTQAQRFTASDAFKNLWEEANRRAHDRIARIIAGDGALDVENGEISIDVGDMLRELQTRLEARGLSVASRFDLSNVDKQIVLVENDQLKAIDSVRSALNLLDTLVIVFFVLTIAAAVAAVLLNPNKLSAVVWLGGAVAVGALVTIIAIQIARQAFLNALTQTVPKGVGEALFDAVANSVKMGFRFILAAGIVAVVLAFLTRLPSYRRYIARPAQVIVLVLAAIALVAPDTYSWLYVISVVLLTAITIACLEVARRPAPATT